MSCFLGAGALIPVEAVAADRDCSDFDNQKKAQRFFREHNPRQDPHRLDSDGDRIACENNPCPCSRQWRRQHGGAALVLAELPSTAAGRCDTLRYGGEQYVFYKQQVRCHWAKRKSKRLHRSGGRRGEPRRFDCQSSSNYRRNGHCEGPGRKLFLWYPEH